MASDSSDPTRRKHHRSSSPDDAEERSKRRKHRHHRRHRHHRHRRNKGIDETLTTTIAEEELIECERIHETYAGEPKLEINGDVGNVLVSNGSDFAGVDYDMEEGEIVDDGLAGGNFDKLKNLDSDVESGEIKPNASGDGSNMGLNDEVVERVDKKSLKLGNDIGDVKKSAEMDQGRASGSRGPANSDANKYHQDDGGIPRSNQKKTNDSDDDVERRAQRKSLSSETRSRPASGPSSHDKSLKDNSHGKSLKSPELSRGRSRSRSILQEASVMGTSHKMEDPYYLKGEHWSDSEDERMIGHGRNYRHVSRDYFRDKERERSSSRYSERTDWYYGRDTHERYRENSRERDGERDRAREKEREREERERDRESARLRDRDRRERERDRGMLMERTKEKERERDRERDKDWERESGKNMERNRGRDRDRHDIRMERNAERNRGSEGSRADVRARSRDREMDRDNESGRFSRRQKHSNDNRNGDRDGENDSIHRRSSENYQRERSNRTDIEHLSSKGYHAERGKENPEREDEGQEDYQERISLQLAEKEVDELERVKEESRRLKQAILEKYNNKPKSESQSEDMVKEKIGKLSDQVSGVEVNVQKTNSQVEGADVYVAESAFIVGKSPSQHGLPVSERPTGIGGLGEGTPKSERSDDMFRDDIFGESPAGARKPGNEGAVAVEKSGLNDNWDDAEGYYCYRFGEILDGRYEIIAAHGKGVFSTVVRAKDLKAKPGHHEEVAIKIIRNNETMYKAGMEELVILNKLVGADPENKRHCVRYLSNFKYRNHLCLVFESLHMNLREVLKKFGRNIGLKLTAVRTYAKQLFIALKHLKNCGVLHSDIKPDNMLVNGAKNVLKLCDFGNAMFSGKNEVTPYLVSRFYRAPEIILGLPYDHPLDIWSVGCCLFELYTGKVLFPGPTNNDMLRLQMELKGPFPKKMLRKGAFTDQHFDQDLNFLAIDEDPVTKKVIRRLIVNIKPKDFGSLISGLPGEDPKMVSNFKDLMEKIFVLDPEKRLTVSQALSHPFITGK